METVDEDQLEGIAIPFQMIAAFGPQAKLSVHYM